MLDELASFAVRHPADDLEPAHHLVPVEIRLGVVRHAGLCTHLSVGLERRRVAVQARAGLRERVAAGLIGVTEHVGVSAILAVVHGERVAGENDLPLGVLFELGKGVAAAVLGAGDIGRPQIALILSGEIPAPDGRVDRLLVEIHNLESDLLRLTLPREDVLHEQQDRDRQARDDHDGGGVQGPALSA